jgi:sugar lactone lactonase YvrE
MQIRKWCWSIFLILTQSLLLAGCKAATATHRPTDIGETGPFVQAAPSPSATIPLRLPETKTTPFLDTEDQTGITTYQLRPTGMVSYVWTIATAADDSLWFGGVMGAVQFTGETWTIYGTEQGLPDDNVQAIVVDKDGAIWFATLGDGVSRLKDRTWTTYSTLNGLIDDSVTSALVASNGDIWFGTYGGASRFNGESWQGFTSIIGLADNTVNAITETPDGTIWFGTNRGVSSFDGYRWKYYGSEQGLQGGVVRTLAVTADGTLWAGSHGTLNYFDGSTWSQIAQDDGLADARIDALYGAPDGSLWVGSIGGISRLLDDLWINYSQDHELQIYDINAIQEGPDGAIWIAGGYNYIYCFYPPTYADDPIPVRNAPYQVFTRPIIPLIGGESVIIEHINMIDSQIGWAIGGSGTFSDHVLRTIDAGQTWHDVSPPALRLLSNSPERTSAYFYNNDNAWVVYNDGPEVWRTLDGGQSWETAQIEFAQSRSDRLYFTDREHGWLLRHVESGMGNEYVALLRTLDGGQSWDELIDPYEDEELQGCLKTGMVFEADNGWITYDCQGLYAQPHIDWTMDGGQTWQTIWLRLPSTIPEEDLSYCSTKDPQLFSITGGAILVECHQFSETAETTDRYVYITSDTGSTWVRHEFPGTELLFIDEQNAFALGEHIFFSSNQGQEWLPVKSVRWQGQFSFIDVTHAWAIATYDDEIALVYTNNGGKTWLEIKPQISME